MKKKILIVSRSFYPISRPRAFRATELAKYFAEQGHDVTVAIPYDPEKHDEIAEKYGFKYLNLGELKFKDLKFNSKGILGFAERVIRRALLQLFEYPDIELMFRVRRALKDQSGYDLLISIAVPHPVHWGVAWARSGKNKVAKTWCADCGDPYMGATFDTFRKMFYFKYLEKWFGRSADYITVPHIDMKVDYYPEFHHKIKEIPQGFRFEESKELLEKYTGNEVPTFAYAGGFIPVVRDPIPLIKVLLKSKIKFKFHVFTHHKHVLEPYLKEAGDRIEIHELIPREQLLGFLSKMDFLVNIAFDPAKQLPSKLIDYYIVGRPILNINNEEGDEDNIIRFLQGDHKGQFLHPKVDQYRIENVSEKFLALTESSK